MVRRGTEKRQRTVVLTQRFSETEAAQIRAIADRTGMSVSSLVRHALLEKSAPRAVRRPTVDHKAVAGVLAQLGKIGSNVNQYAKHRNMGRSGDRLDDAMYAALRDLSELRLACLQALGYERSDDEPEPPLA